MALPLIVRAIPYTRFFDCTSVYGYCGLISSIDVKIYQIYPQKKSLFKEQLLWFFDSNVVVTAFSRLHPLISTDAFFNDFGLIKDINKTVAIDLCLSLEEQSKQYFKSVKRELKKMRRKCFEIVEAQTREDFDVFIAIYHETMHRV